MAMENTDVCFALAPEQIASLAGVDVTTARRWKRGKPIPEPARRLLEILTTGNLERFSRPWRGWWIDHARGLLVSPEQWSFRPGEILSLPLLHGMISSWQSQARAAEERLKLAVQADWVAGRYVEPGEHHGHPEDEPTRNITPRR